MTRKDYVLLADALRYTLPDVCREISLRQHANDCEAVANALAKENPRFDRARFLAACGVAS